MNTRQQRANSGNRIALGVLIVIVSLFCFLCSVGAFGGVGDMVYSFLIGFFGLAEYGYSVVGIIIGAAVIFNIRPKMAWSRFFTLAGIFFLGVLALHVYTSSAHIEGSSYGDYLVKCYDNTNTAGGMLFGILAFPIMKAITSVGALALVCALAFALIFFAFFPYVKKNVTYTSERRKLNKSGAYRKGKSGGEKIGAEKVPVITDLSAEGDKKLFVVDVDGGAREKRSRRAKGAEGYDMLYPNKNGNIEDEERIPVKYAASDRYTARGLAKDILFGDGDSETYARFNAVNDPSSNALNSVGASFSAIRRTEMRSKLGIDPSDNVIKENFLRRYRDEEDKKKPSDTSPEKSGEAEDILPMRKDAPGAIDFETLKRDQMRLFNTMYEKRERESVAYDTPRDGGDTPEKKEVVRPTKIHHNGGMPMSDTVRKAQEAVGASSMAGFTGTVARAMTGEKQAVPATGREIEAEAYERPQIKVQKQPKPEVKIPRAFADSAVNTSARETVKAFGAPEVVRENSVRDDKLNVAGSAKNEPVMPKVSEASEGGALNRTPYKSALDGTLQSGRERGAKEQEEAKRRAEAVNDLGAAERQRALSEAAARDERRMRENIVGAIRETPPLSAFEKEQALKAGKMKAAAERGAVQLQQRKEAQKQEVKKEETPVPVRRRPYVAPPIELLEKPEPEVDQNEDYDLKKNALIDTLATFSINAEVTDIRVGPTFSLYTLTVEMPRGRSIGTITNLDSDIAMRMAEESVRILAPIPGKNAVGIEVPNRKRRMVRLSEILTSPVFNQAKEPASFALGKNLYGSDFVCNIAKMPHLLIAGATGAGKSCCINSLIVSLLYKASPDDVRLILIDPKRVEMSIYQGIPHLLMDEIVCDADKAIRALNWTITEMNRRMEVLKETGLRNMEEYNEECAKTGAEKMPRIVVVVDELADLMFTGKKAVEDSINRIARLSRAAGIHLILATQRPSVDVISGTIKNNLPSRIAFKVTSPQDSKTVLDGGGAEKLLGNGDLLYMTPQSALHERVQGAFISTAEVERIVKFIKENNDAYFDNSIKDAIFKEQTEERPDGKDGVRKKSGGIPPEVFDALSIGMDGTLITISLLQRKLGLGWPKAAKTFDMIQDMGYFVPDEKDSKKMRVNITEEEFAALMNGGDEEEE